MKIWKLGEFGREKTQGRRRIKMMKELAASTVFMVEDSKRNWNTGPHDRVFVVAFHSLRPQVVIRDNTIRDHVL